MQLSEKIYIIKKLSELAYEYPIISKALIGVIRDVISVSDLLTTQEQDAGMTQGKLAAVRAYRDRTGLSLIESKRVVEKYFEYSGLTFGKS